MFDLKVIGSVLAELEDERGIPREKVIDAIETALATAYKKEYGKRGQIIRAEFDPTTGSVEFSQIKIVVDESRVRVEDADDDAEETEQPAEDTEDERVRFDPEKHIFIEDAKKMKKDAELDEEIVFPLELHDDYGRIAAQTAKQVIIQKIREAEKVSVMEEYGEREGEIVSGTVQRMERGNVYIDLGRAQAIMPYDEQVPGERYRTGDRIRAYLYSVDESPRGVFLRVSRSHPKFLEKLFEIETPELAAGTVEIKAIAREPGSRSKIAVVSHDEHIDPVGSLVGQRGVRVTTVMSELGGEKIDVIEWSEEPKDFIADALSPAEAISVEVDEAEGKAIVEVTSDQQSLAIGRGGQNVRLAAKLTGWRIDIRSLEGEQIAEADEESVEVTAEPAEPATEVPTGENTVQEEGITPAEQPTEAAAVVEEQSNDERPANLPENAEDAIATAAARDKAKQEEAADEGKTEEKK